MSGVIVDTCIWSLAFRGKTPRNHQVVAELTSLIKENRAKIIGLIRQEILSGYSYRYYPVMKMSRGYSYRYYPDNNWVYPITSYNTQMSNQIMEWCLL